MDDVLLGIKELSEKDILIVEAIADGLSSDRKYFLETINGERMLLRISDRAEAERKSAEYVMTAHAFAHAIPTSQPLGFGLCEDGEHCYSLFGWIEGVDADRAMAGMSPTEQYRLGMQSGKLLRNIHGIPIPGGATNDGVAFDTRAKARMGRYAAKPQVHCGAGEKAARFLMEQIGTLPSRQQTFIHGDFNTENIIVMSDGTIGVIDFNSYNTMCGDPWGELSNMAWMPTVYPEFHSGQMNAYFGGEPPEAFWKAFSFSLACTALAALTDSYELNGIEDGMGIAQRILEWTDDFRSRMPLWFRQDGL